MKDVQPLLFYREPTFYAGLGTIIGIVLLIYPFVATNSYQISGTWLVVTTLLGATTYLMWTLRCPNCRRTFCKKEQKAWEEDLGIKEEPFTYHTKLYQYSDGSTDPVSGSEKTIMRPKKYDRQFYLCSKCEYGSEKEWSKITSRWIGNEPRVEYIKKKGQAHGFGIDLFQEETYEYHGKRRNIPRGVKEDLWIRNFGKKWFGNCFVCSNSIETKRFEAGHVISVANGGSDNISNLKPLCMKCNRSMGTLNLFEYKERHYSKNHTQAHTR